MRLIALILVLLLVSPSACAEAMWGEIGLTPTPEAIATHGRHYIPQTSYLHDESQLRMGEIYDVDIVDTTVLVVVWLGEKRQLWVWDIADGFQYGYELEWSKRYAESGLWVLSPDGSILHRAYRAEFIVGYRGHGDDLSVSLYAVPQIVQDRDYAFPARSAYGVADCQNGRLVLNGPDGEQLLLFDRSQESILFQNKLTEETKPILILRLVLLGPFLFVMFKTISYIEENRKEEDEDIPPRELRGYRH